MPAYSASNIPAFEFRAIKEILQAHLREHGDALKSYIVFGALVETGESDTIDLLEVVQEWQGPRRLSFTSTADLPLRGRLNLYFLQPEEFEHPTPELLSDEEISSLQLLNRVEQAYTILMEQPTGYAFNTMKRFGTTDNSPLSLLRYGRV